MIITISKVVVISIWTNISSSCCAASTDFPDSLSLSLSPFISIIPRFRMAFLTTSCVHTKLVIQNLNIHVKGSIGEHHLWVHPYFSSSVPHILSILFGWFYWWEVGSIQLLFVGCCFQVLSNITHSISVQFLSGFFYIRLVGIHVVHPYSRIDLKKWPFILSAKFDFYMIDKLSIAVRAFASHKLMSFSVDEILLLKYMNLSTIFRKSPLSMKMSLFWLKHMYSILSAFTWRPMPPAACSRLCNRDN